MLFLVFHPVFGEILITFLFWIKIWRPSSINVEKPISTAGTRLWSRLIKSWYCHIHCILHPSFRAERCVCVMGGCCVGQQNGNLVHPKVMMMVLTRDYSIPISKIKSKSGASCSGNEIAQPRSQRTIGFSSFT